MLKAGEAPAVLYVNRFLAGLLFGGQVVWSVAVLPTYRHLKATEYLKVHTLLTWYGDALMPLLGLSTTMSGYLRYRRTGQLNALLGVCALAGASIAAARNLRINVQMREARAAAMPASESELQSSRDRWAIQHLIRTSGGLIAFALFLSDGGPKVSFGRPSSRVPVGWLDLVAAFVLVRSGREVIGHLAMMLGLGKEADMGRALGIRR